jgi:hypothetical protein
MEQTMKLFELSPDMNDRLDDLADGADEVEFMGKTYRRTGPKNSSSEAGPWKEVKEK